MCNQYLVYCETGVRTIVNITILFNILEKVYFFLTLELCKIDIDFFSLNHTPIPVT
jgi:hypothetical protein